MSADFMILRLTTVHENARSALECGGLKPPSPLGLHAGGTLRRRQAAALQGAFGTAIFMAGGYVRIDAHTCNVRRGGYAPPVGFSTRKGRMLGHTSLSVLLGPSTGLSVTRLGDQDRPISKFAITGGATDKLSLLMFPLPLATSNPSLFNNIPALGG